MLEDLLPCAVSAAWASSPRGGRLVLLLRGGGGGDAVRWEALSGSLARTARDAAWWAGRGGTLVVATTPRASAALGWFESAGFRTRWPESSGTRRFLWSAQRPPRRGPCGNSLFLSGPRRGRWRFYALVDHGGELPEHSGGQ